MSSLSAEAQDGRQPKTLRGMLQTLRSAYDRGGVEGLSKAHAEMLRSSLRYRAVHGLVSLAVPAGPLLAEARTLDRLIGDRGACMASRAVLSRLRVPWQIDMPERGVSDILSAPVVFYGRRGAAFTPLLLAAALDRDDLRAVAASHIAKLGPHVGRLSFPVHPTPREPRKGEKRRRASPPLGAWIALAFDTPIERDEARARNRASLTHAIEHVRSGGSLIIAPDPRERRTPWRQGIGVIVVGLAHDSGARPAHIVPWSISHVPTTTAFRLLSRNPLVRSLARMRFHHPVHVAFGEPVPVRRIVELAGYNPAKVAEYLERDYRERGL